MLSEYKTDWLASCPVFYNEKTGRVSENINEVIDYSNIEFHPEGLKNYLDFGYSVFEQTPIKYVKFLRHSSRLFKDEYGKIQVEHFKDPVENLINNRSTGSSAIELIKQRINEWEKNTQGEIVIPTSGGFDSRLLNALIQDKSKIRAYTYGISDKQCDSYEVVKAKKLAEILKIRWEQIQLGDFHKYFNEWDKLFGISTHAHGMYHMEFYSIIANKIGTGQSLLSGIIGDAWAGNVIVGEISNEKELYKLGYTHGLNASSEQCLLKSNNLIKEQFFYENRHKFKDNNWKIIFAMRLKIILLSYLIRIPNYYGFNAWSPFLDIDVAIEMLNIDWHEKKDRIWQRKYFEKNELDLESLNLKFSNYNTLDEQGLINIAPEKLDKDILREIIDPKYIEWVNNNISNTRINKLKRGVFKIPRLNGAIYRLGIKESTMQAYNAYLTLKPIENVLIKRNEAYRRIK